MPGKDKIESRPPLKKISVAALQAVHSWLSTDYPNDPGDVSQILANEIAIHYLGRSWYEKYAMNASRHATYLGVCNNAAPNEITYGISRFLEFSETLLNLQSIEGFEAVLDQLHGGKIESACAEIDVARMLFFQELRFRFVEPKQVTKLDYDFEIFYPDGFKVYAETKCKLEGRTLRAKSVIKSLKRAREQLPDDSPSVILVKIPEKSLHNIEVQRAVIGQAKDYLRQSDHIMSVKFYSSITIHNNGTTRRLYAFNEISNPKFPDRDWDMFRDDIPLVNGRPSWWISFFPEMRIPN
jgi:hypothetical protein